MPEQGRQMNTPTLIESQRGPARRRARAVSAARSARRGAGAKDGGARAARGTPTEERTVGADFVLGEVGEPLDPLPVARALDRIGLVRG